MNPHQNTLQQLLGDLAILLIGDVVGSTGGHPLEVAVR